VIALVSRSVPAAMGHFTPSAGTRLPRAGGLVVLRGRGVLVIGNERVSRAGWRCRRHPTCHATRLRERRAGCHDHHGCLQSAARPAGPGASVWLPRDRPV